MNRSSSGIAAKTNSEGGETGRGSLPLDEGFRTSGLTRRQVVSGRGSLKRSRIWVLLLAALVAPAAVNAFGGSYMDYAFAIGTIEGLAVLSSNLVAGYLGEITLATGAFMAVGAYSVAALSPHMGFVLATTVALVICGVAGLAVALQTSRLRGAQAALATFALAWALPDVLNTASGVTGGPLGKYVLAVPELVVKFESGSLAMSYLVSGVFALCGIGCLLAIYGRWGRLVLASSEARPAAESFGVPTPRVKIVVWVLASLIAGLAGALYAPASGYLSPGEFTYQLSLFIFVGTVIGGTRSVPGAWIGGLVVGMVPQVISSSIGGADVLIFGVLLLVVVLAARGGVYPELELAASRGAALVRRVLARSWPGVSS